MEFGLKDQKREGKKKIKNDSSFAKPQLIERQTIKTYADNFNNLSRKQQKVVLSKLLISLLWRVIPDEKGIDPPSGVKEAMEFIGKGFTAITPDYIPSQLIMHFLFDMMLLTKRPHHTNGRKRNVNINQLPQVEAIPWGMGQQEKLFTYPPVDLSNQYHNMDTDLLKSPNMDQDVPGSEENIKWDTFHFPDDECVTEDERDEGQNQEYSDIDD